MDSTKLYYKSALELTRLVQKKELGYLINYLTIPHWIPSWFPHESSKALVLIGTKDITAA